MNPQKKVDLKLIIVGALGVGKTSLLHQYVHNTFYEDYQTTLGASILSKIIRVEDTTLKLQIWDTGGQERFRSVVSTFYKGSDGCILAFDVTDLESFEALDIWRGDVLAKIIPVEQPYPMVVLGNKIDLADRKEATSKSSWKMEQRDKCIWGKHSEIHAVFPYMHFPRTSQRPHTDIAEVRARELLGVRGAGAGAQGPTTLSTVGKHASAVCSVLPRHVLAGFITHDDPTPAHPLGLSLANTAHRGWRCGAVGKVTACNATVSHMGARLSPSCSTSYPAPC
uniref:Ras-related protein Rab-7b n=1 Tax=Oryctolagus cuniculus TaxID=9986 RepID=A0A5F9C6I1_RABIT